MFVVFSVSFYLIHIDFLFCSAINVSASNETTLKNLYQLEGGITSQVMERTCNNPEVEIEDCQGRKDVCESRERCGVPKVISEEFGVVKGGDESDDDDDDGTWSAVFCHHCPVGELASMIERFSGGKVIRHPLETKNQNELCSDFDAWIDSDSSLEKESSTMVIKGLPLDDVNNSLARIQHAVKESFLDCVDLVIPDTGGCEPKCQLFGDWQSWTYGSCTFTKYPTTPFIIDWPNCCLRDKLHYNLCNYKWVGIRVVLNFSNLAHEYYSGPVEKPFTITQHFFIQHLETCSVTRKGVARFTSYGVCRLTIEIEEDCEFECNFDPENAAVYYSVYPEDVKKLICEPQYLYNLNFGKTTSEVSFHVDSTSGFCDSFSFANTTFKKILGDYYLRERYVDSNLPDYRHRDGAGVLVFPCALLVFLAWAHVFF